MCKCLSMLFKKKEIVKKVNTEEYKFKKKRPGPIITNVEDFTSVAKQKKKHQILFKFVGEHGIKI